MYVNPHIKVAGRLRLFAHNWQQLSSDSWVLQAISGYQIEFLQHPYQQKYPIPHHFSNKQVGIISDEVQALLDKGAIVECTGDTCSGEFISNIFLVPKPGGKFRPVINLKNLNQFVTPHHFKMEGLHSVRSLLQENDYMVKIDLKDAYFTVPICSSSQKFLRFLWNQRKFQFCCLPFGLSSAPWVFTKVLKPVIAYLRTQGVRIVAYLDDLLLMCQSQAILREHTALAIYLLQVLGFVINWEKSELNPVQRIIYLGFLINSIRMTISLPEEKIMKLRKEAGSILRKKEISLRTLASFIGLASSTIPAVLPAPLWYRNLQMLKIRQLHLEESYDSLVKLSPEEEIELTWWKEELQTWNGRQLLDPQQRACIGSDASSIGWGATHGNQSTGGFWSESERTMHINALELLAAKFAVQAFLKERPPHLLILLKTDNSTTAACINKMGGTHSILLNTITKSLWLWCLERQFLLRAEHIPGVENIYADWHSRNILDRSDWSLSKQVFQQINSMWGPISIDLFASRLNAQCQKYFSWFPDPQAVATDAFTQDWGQYQLCFLNPPWILMGRCLAQVTRQRATAVVIAPLWPSQSWYSQLLLMAIDHPRILPPLQDLIIPGPSKLVPTVHQDFWLTAWLVSGDPSKQMVYRNKHVPCFWHHGGKKPTGVTSQPGRYGVAGAVQREWIPLIPL